MLYNRYIALLVGLYFLLLKEIHAVERRQVLSVDEGTPITIDNEIIMPTSEIMDKDDNYEATSKLQQAIIEHSFEEELPENYDKDLGEQLENTSTTNAETTMLPITTQQQGVTVDSSENLNSSLAEMALNTTSALAQDISVSSESDEIESSTEIVVTQAQSEEQPTSAVNEPILGTDTPALVPATTEVPISDENSANSTTDEDSASSTTEQPPSSNTKPWYANLFSFYPTLFSNATNSTSANQSQPLLDLGFLTLHWNYTNFLGSWHLPFFTSNQNNVSSARFGFFKRYPVTNSSRANQTYFFKAKPFHKAINVTGLNSTTVVYNKFAPRNFTKFNFFLLKQQQLQQQLLQQQVTQLRQNQQQQARQEQEQEQNVARKPAQAQQQEQQQLQEPEQQPPQPLYIIPLELETQQQVDNRLLWQQERAKSQPNLVQIEALDVASETSQTLRTEPEQKSDNARTSILLEVEIPNPLVRFYNIFTGLFA